MEDKKPVFVNNRTYAQVVKRLGYDPVNMYPNRFLPEGEAIVLNTEYVKTPFYSGYKPMFYLKK